MTYYPPVILLPHTGLHYSAQTLLELPHYSPAEIVCHHISPGNDFGYWDFVNSWWEYPGDLGIVEQHMVIQSHSVMELISCKEPLCSQAYKRSGEFYWCHNTEVAPFSHEPYRGKWLEPGMGIDRAMFSGLGCCKLSPSVRRGKWLRVTRWPVLDLAVSAALNHSWHIHWPGVEHNHYLPGAPPPGAGEEWYQTKLEERKVVIP